MDDTNKRSFSANNGQIPNRPTDEESVKHNVINELDEQIGDETSALGSMPEEPMDIDAARAAMGQPNDDNGPQPLREAGLDHNGD